ncbi:MAG: hypothetical protein R6V76_04255 [Desulfobacterales bacterium]
MKRKLFFVLIVCLFWSFASSAFAASTMNRVGLNPFYRPPLTSEADLGALVRSQDKQINNGFVKAGYPDLYPAFSEQFPSTAIDSIKVFPGETFQWMLFKKKGTGPVIVTKDVTWGGAGPLDAYRFYIDNKGKRYEFVVLNACGNFSLKNITDIPAPIPAPPEKAAVVLPAPIPAPPEKAVVALPAPPPPVVAEPPAPPEPPLPMRAAKRLGGPVIDAGYLHQYDPANYLFARIGYEFPLFDNLSLLALVGGAVRVDGDDGGSAFIADAILDYHWSRLSFGVGAGYWSDNGGQLDMIVNLGVLVFGNPDSFNGTLFIEARSDVEEVFDTVRDLGRLGLGMRFRF